MNQMELEAQDHPVPAYPNPGSILWDKDQIITLSTPMQITR